MGQEALRIAGELVLVHTGILLAGAGEIEGDAIGDDQDLHYLTQALSPHTVTTMERCGGATVMRFRGAVT